MANQAAGRRAAEGGRLDGRGQEQGTAAFVRRRAVKREQEAQRQADLATWLEGEVHRRWNSGPIPPLAGGPLFRHLADVTPYGSVTEDCLRVVAVALGLWPWSAADVIRAAACAADGTEFDGEMRAWRGLVGRRAP